MLVLAGCTVADPRRFNDHWTSLGLRSTVPVPCWVNFAYSLSCLWLIFPISFTDGVLCQIYKCLFILGSRVAVPHWVWGCCTSLGLKLLYLAGSTVAVPYRVHIRCSSSVLRSLYLIGSAVAEPRRVYGWWPPSVAVPRWVYGWWSSLVAVPRRVYGW